MEFNISKIKDSFYYIFIYPIGYVLAALAIFLFWLFCGIGQNRTLRRMCKRNGHLWKYKRGSYEIAYARYCSRCNKYEHKTSNGNYE